MTDTIDPQIMRSLYDGADPIHDFAHVQRVVAMADRIARAESADIEIVRMAALLHDISRADEDNHQAGDHALLAADEARVILSEAGSSAEFIEAVAHAIAAHRFRNEIEPQTIEAKVLFDADKLDVIGAIGVARSFAFGGQLGQPLWGEVSPDYQPGGEELHTAHHEFHFKLRHINERFYTESGRVLAEERHNFMLAFFDQMAAEIGGER